MKSLVQDLIFACKRKCPVCREGQLFSSWFSFEPHEYCASCRTYLKDQDVGDGAVVLLIFILGFTLIPAALVWEFHSSPPIWLQALVWGTVGMVCTFVLTPVIKTYIMLLQYRHRESEWQQKMRD